MKRTNVSKEKTILTLTPGMLNSPIRDTFLKKLFNKWRKNEKKKDT